MASAKSEVNSIISELNSIINELNSISAAMKTEFKGIGTEKCAESINSVIANCKKAKKSLSNINMNQVTDSWAAAHSTAEGSGT